MPERQAEPNQQQTCRNNQQNRINNKHVATMNKTESTTDMSQQPTDMPQQRTEPMPSSHLCFVCWRSFHDLRWSLLSDNSCRILYAFQASPSMTASGARR
jgi:hypothetical protein